MDELDKSLEANWASTVDVYIQVNFTKIYDVDTINQRFQAEAFIESKWFDPNIKSLNEQIDTTKIWKPDIYVENAISDLKDELTHRVLPDKQKMYMICEIRKFKGTFYENLELENFPLDVQDLTLMVASKKPGKIVNLISMQPEVHKIKISNTLDKSMWQMYNIVITKKDQIIREYSYGRRKYPALRVAAQVFRSAGFFFWNAILPIFLITLASLAPFVIDPKIPQSRLPSTATMLLTSVSIRWIVGRLLPTVSYLTSLDKYSLGTMMIITMQLLYHAIFGAIFHSLPEKLAYQLDKIIFAIFLTFIIIKQIVFLIWILKIKRFREKLRKNEIVQLSSAIEFEQDDNDDENEKKSCFKRLQMVETTSEKNHFKKNG
jgi:hypothetical protein